MGSGNDDSETSSIETEANVWSFLRYKSTFIESAILTWDVSSTSRNFG